MSGLQSLSSLTDTIGEWLQNRFSEWESTADLVDAGVDKLSNQLKEEKADLLKEIGAVRQEVGRRAARLAARTPPHPLPLHPLCSRRRAHTVVLTPSCSRRRARQVLHKVDKLHDTVAKLLDETQKKHSHR